MLAPSVQIGVHDGESAHAAARADFFDQGGFAAFRSAGLGAATAQAGQFVPGVFIAPGTVIAPVVTQLVARRPVRRR